MKSNLFQMEDKVKMNVVLIKRIELNIYIYIYTYIFIFIYSLCHPCKFTLATGLIGHPLFSSLALTDPQTVVNYTLLRSSAHINTRNH